MYALLVYFAGTSESITIGSIILVLASALASGLSAESGPRKGIPSPKFFALVGVTFFLIAIFIPSEKTLYKMAGVTDQQKAIIDAAGNIK